VREKESGEYGLRRRDEGRKRREKTHALNANEAPNPLYNPSTPCSLTTCFAQSIGPENCFFTGGPVEAAVEEEREREVGACWSWSLALRSSMGWAMKELGKRSDGDESDQRRRVGGEREEEKEGGQRTNFENPAPIPATV